MIPLTIFLTLLIFQKLPDMALAALIVLDWWRA